MARWIWVLVLVAGLVVLGGGIWVLVAQAGLENADRVASVVGAAMGVLGVAGTVVGAVRARRAGAPPASVSLTAEATGSGRVYQVGNGDMRVGE